MAEENTLDTDQFMSEKTKEFFEPIQRSKPEPSKNPEVEGYGQELAQGLASDNSVTTTAVEEGSAYEEQTHHG